MHHSCLKFFSLNYHEGTDLRKSQFGRNFLLQHRFFENQPNHRLPTTFRNGPHPVALAKSPGKLAISKAERPTGSASSFCAECAAGRWCAAEYDGWQGPKVLLPVLWETPGWMPVRLVAFSFRGRSYVVFCCCSFLLLLSTLCFSNKFTFKILRTYRIYTYLSVNISVACLKSFVTNVT
jgi:hypothetical protein